VERPCENPHCQYHGTLTDQVPERIKHCSDCQYDMIKLTEEHPFWNAQDVEFVFLHPAGCFVTELTTHLDDNNVSDYVRKGKIEAKKILKRPDGKMLCYFIEYDEMVRIIVIYREWVTVTSLLDISGVCLMTLHEYANSPLSVFGRTIIHPSGAICIHRREIPGLKAKCQDTKKKRLADRNLKNANLKKGDMTRRYFAGLCQVQQLSVNHWVLLGHLQLVKRGKRFIITHSRAIRFISDALAGKHRLLPKTLEKFESVLTRLTNMPS